MIIPFSLSCCCCCCWLFNSLTVLTWLIHALNAYSQHTVFHSFGNFYRGGKAISFVRIYWWIWPIHFHTPLCLMTQHQPYRHKHTASVNSKFHFHVYTPNYIEKKNQLKKNIPSKNPKKQCYRVDFSTNEHNIFNLRPFLRHFLHLSNWFDWMFRFFPKFSLRLLVSFWRLKMIFRRFTEQAFFFDTARQYCSSIYFLFIKFWTISLLRSRNKWKITENQRPMLITFFCYFDRFNGFFVCFHFDGVCLLMPMHSVGSPNTPPPIYVSICISFVRFDISDAVQCCSIIHSLTLFLVSHRTNVNVVRLFDCDFVWQVEVFFPLSSLFFCSTLNTKTKHVALSVVVITVWRSCQVE